MNDRKTHDPLRVNARNLRKSMTPQERRLWYDFLKNLPQTVYRQKIIGNFIVDFYISSCKLVIELDGAQHTEPQAVEYDAQRTAYLQGIGCRVLPTRYPQGAEKMLIHSLLQREVPSGKLPADVGVVVNNVGTLAMLGELLPQRAGLIERVVTVSGPGVRQAGNYLIPLGTRIGDGLRHAGMESGEMEVILGGPMMGMSAPSLDIPVTKGMSGILVFPVGSLPERHRQPCIRCGQCIDACPMGLNPSLLGRLAGKQEYYLTARHGVLDCIECGACTLSCPSGIPLVQYHRMSKSILRQRRHS